MTGRRLIALLTLALTLLLAGAVALTVLYYSRLDEYKLPGPLIVGLCFFAIAIFGIYLQLSSDIDDNMMNRQIVRQFAVYLLQMLIFIPSFVGGMWLLFRLFEVIARFIPDGFAAFAVVVAFTWYVWAVIKVLGWLSARGIIGRGLNSTED